MLEGGIEGRPENAVFYATSNRRHLMARDMIENESSTAIHPGEAVEESVSLSDRFGLWLGFHACDQQTYFDMIEGYVKRAWNRRSTGSSQSCRHRVEHDPRRTLGPSRLAVRAGFGRTQGNDAQRRIGLKRSGLQQCYDLARYFSGLTGLPLRRNSKCACGDATLPVLPA